ncbi:MAG: ATP-binding protein, partial [Spirochaetaceae bacterium]|nr:ATP-binding protein [Spirochaetaceae bacterium]
TDTVERVRGRVAHIVDLIRTQKSFDRQSMTSKLIDLRQSIADAVNVLAESCATRGIDVAIDCARAPRELRIQENRFHQMLVNLVKNAIEAIDALAAAGGAARRDPPRIRIACYPRDEFLVLDVIDNGIGIGEQRHRLIFTAGYSTKESSSGLGLHSAANFVIGSGGRIEALSDGHGAGTTIRVMLRRAAPAEQRAQAEQAGASAAAGQRFAPPASA